MDELLRILENIRACGVRVASVNYTPSVPGRRLTVWFHTHGDLTTVATRMKLTVRVEESGGGMSAERHYFANPGRGVRFSAWSRAADKDWETKPSPVEQLSMDGM